MSLQAVADIVAKGDPDRFDACMAAPVAARVVLFPIYAFNVEVARATWVMSEPKIGELRLQWLRDALEDIARGQFREYLDETGGGLIWVAARALGGDDEAGFRALGRISGLANFLLAVPRLNARMDWPLPVGGPETVQQLARDALTELRALQLPKAGRAASLASWRAGTILRRAADEPDRVAHGTLPESEFRRRLSLIWAGYRL
ncbi:MAG: phytoene synthase [Boseongicola sp. SB0676_bin_33]|nr:phytoene synthase [Boseongicola sp. SB0676_bin_33]